MPCFFKKMVWQSLLHGKMNLIMWNEAFSLCLWLLENKWLYFQLLEPSGTYCKIIIAKHFANIIYCSQTSQLWNGSMGFSAESTWTSHLYPRDPQCSADTELWRQEILGRITWRKYSSRLLSSVSSVSNIIVHKSMSLLYIRMLAAITGWA